MSTAAQFHHEMTSRHYATGDAAWSQIALHRYGEVVENLRDIDQCIRVILGTPYGSDALRPAFGSELWRYIDYPSNEVSPYLIRESYDAIKRWEPRCAVDDVQISVQAHHVRLTLHWHPEGMDSKRQTRIELPRRGLS